MVISGIFLESWPVFLMKNILRVQMAYPDAGFFVYLEFVINAIIYCQGRDDYTPVPEVDFGAQHPAGKNHFHEAAHGENMFDYFFSLKRKNCTLHHLFSKRVEKPSGFWRYIHSNLGIQCYPHGRHKDLRRYYDRPCAVEVGEWYRHNRTLAHSIIDQHIAVNPEVLNRVEERWLRLFQPEAFVVGIHARGTDKAKGVGGRKILPVEYFPYMDRLIDRKDAVFFLATDDDDYLHVFRERYRDRIFFNSVLRHERNVFKVMKYSSYQKGLEVLVDCLMLSRCQFLLKCSSAVSEFAVYFGSRLREYSLDLQYDCSAFLAD